MKAYVEEISALKLKIPPLNSQPYNLIKLIVRVEITEDIPKNVIQKEYERIRPYFNEPKQKRTSRMRTIYEKATWYFDVIYINYSKKAILNIIKELEPKIKYAEKNIDTFDKEKLIPILANTILENYFDNDRYIPLEYHYILYGKVQEAYNDFMKKKEGYEKGMAKMKEREEKKKQKTEQLRLQQEAKKGIKQPKGKMTQNELKNFLQKIKAYALTLNPKMKIPPLATAYLLIQKIVQRELELLEQDKISDVKLFRAYNDLNPKSKRKNISMKRLIYEKAYLYMTKIYINYNWNTLANLANTLEPRIEELYDTTEIYNPKDKLVSIVADLVLQEYFPSRYMKNQFILNENLNEKEEEDDDD